MSYLSKSKLMSFRSAMAANSLGAGRAVVGAAVVPGVVAGALLPGVLAGAVAAIVPGVVAAAPVGAGAAAWVVAGRLAQPTSTTPRTSSVANMTWEQRLSMFPPFWPAQPLPPWHEKSYHGRRGDHEGLVLSVCPRVSGVGLVP